MVKEYIKDCWRELWNPDSRVWQYIDRIAFMLLPLISLVFAIIFKASDESESWRVMMANLAWVIPLLIWFLVLLVVVPYKVANKYKLQFNEARALLLAKPKPIPLENRKELRGAIALVEDTTMQLANKVNALKNADSQNPYLADLAMAADKAHEHWNDSMNELRRQYLIAGDAYESVCIELSGFIWMQIWPLMDKIKYPPDIKPIIMKDMLKFAGELASRVKKSLQQVDEISGQVPDRGDSRT